MLASNGKGEQLLPLPTTILQLRSSLSFSSLLRIRLATALCRDSSNFNGLCFATTTRCHRCCLGFACLARGFDRSNFSLVAHFIHCAPQASRRNDLAGLAFDRLSDHPAILRGGQLHMRSTGQTSFLQEGISCLTDDRNSRSAARPF